VPYDSVQLSVGAPPLTAINVTGTVLDADAVGTVDFGLTIAAVPPSSIHGPSRRATAGGWSVPRALPLPALT
jgi:hypothetical protein